MRDVDQTSWMFHRVFPLLQVAHLHSFSAIDGNIHNLSSDISFPYGSHEPKM